MLAASAVDSMLKAKGYLDGSLYKRIDKAVAQNLITEDMGKWAHAVRLDANDQRHADDNADLPTEADARRVLDFARTLGEIMFVLPSRVERGLKNEPNEEGANAAGELNPIAFAMGAPTVKKLKP